MEWTSLHNGVSRLRRRGRALARFEEWGLPGWARRGALLLTVFVISAQILAYLMPGYPLDRDRYRIRRTSGLKTPWVYVFGLYYWGKFPVYSTVVLKERNPERFSPEYADRILEKKGGSLWMEFRHLARHGNNLQFYLPWLGARVVGRALGPRETMRTLPFVHAAFYLLALYLLLHQFSRAGRPLLGCLTALLISSSEFQAVEITRWNVFGYAITAAVFTLALLAPLIFNRRLGRIRLAVRLLIVAGGIITIGNIRSDSLTMILAPVLVLLLYRPLRFPWRMGAAAGFLLFCWAWNTGIRAYFDFKWRQAEEFVVEHGGTPYTGDRSHSHVFWHQFWVGLADFDTIHGHQWSDSGPWYYALGIMRERGIEIDEIGPRGTQEERDRGQYFYIADHPDYEPIIRERMVSLIRSEPLWYLNIIRLRLKKIFTEWQEARVNLVLWRISLPYSFWPYLIFFIGLLFLKMDGEIKLIVASTPIALVPLIITTLTNVHFNFIGHLVAAAVFLSCLLNAAAFGFYRLTGKTSVSGSVIEAPVEEPPRTRYSRDFQISRILIILAIPLMILLAANLLLYRPPEKPSPKSVISEEDIAEESLTWVAENPLYRRWRLALPFDGSLGNRSHIRHLVTTDERPEFNPNGKHGKSYVFRNGNHITIPKYSFGHSGTWAFWFRLEEDYDPDKQMRLLDTNGTTIVFQGDSLTAFFHDGRFRRISHPVPEAGRWHHLALTWDSADRARGVKLYLNGEPVGTTPYSGVPGFPLRTLRIGCSWNLRHPFSGEIDEFYAFDRALAAGEIEELMETPMPEPPWFEAE